MLWTARVLLGISFLVGCGPIPSAVENVASGDLPIEGGYSDPSARAVVGILVTDEAGRIVRTCSGVLVSRALVVTAQHCVVAEAHFEGCESSRFSQALSPAQVYVTFDRSMWAGETEWHEVRSIAVPTGTSACGRDIATLILATAAPSEVLPLEPRLERPTQPGELYAAIGFGRTATGLHDAGERRRLDGLTVECVGDTCHGGSEVDSAEWRGDDGICSGDSGGPALDADERVIGITSRGPEGCASPIYQGVSDHGTWLENQAMAAAVSGDARPPDWVGQTPVGQWRAEPLSPAWGACATQPNTGRPAAWLLAFALAFARWRVRSVLWGAPGPARTPVLA